VYRGEKSKRDGYHYPARYYDEQLMLKVPILLWFVMAILVRDLALLGITFVPRSGEAIHVLRDYVQPLYIIADVPALAVLLAAIRRKPGASGWMRIIWRWGRGLLALSALLHLGLWLIHFGSAQHWNPSRLHEGVILTVVIDAAILSYVLRSSLLADLFRDLPAAADPTPDPPHL
jgi:hypothetical protein